MLTGIWPVLPTPFDSGGQIDPTMMKRLVRFAVDAGVDGLVFPGFASEVDELTGAERERLLQLVVDEVAGRIPVVAGASAPTAGEAVRHAQSAQAVGLNLVMIQAPKSVGLGADAVSAFYREIAAGAPGIEIVLQNAPAPRGSDLAPQTILDIVRANPSIRYVKEETLPSGRAISAILTGKPDHLLGVMGGGGARYIIDEYNRGACGAMPAVEIADIHVAIDRAYRRGDVPGARDLYMRSLPLLVIQANYRMRLTKHVLARRGIIDAPAVRARLPEFDEHDIREIDACLALLGIETVDMAEPVRRVLGAR